ncbi:MAG: hypothetical protein JWM86_1124, partial [Thermoleophilia bacterium]|nr:hypothetical protein [Thermoleophilia bacterium]
PTLRAQLTHVAAQLALLLNAGAERLATLLPSRGDGGATAAAPAPDAASAPLDLRPPAMPLQPPPPPLGPTFTLDPHTGTIDVPAGAIPIEPGSLPGEDPGSDGASTTPPIGIGIPSAWMPWVGRLRPASLRRDLRSLLERIDALLDEHGVTRLQLLLAMIAVPVATAFLIDVVATILDGR